MFLPNSFDSSTECGIYRQKDTDTHGNVHANKPQRRNISYFNAKQIQKYNELDEKRDEWEISAKSYVAKSHGDRLHLRIK